MINILLFIVFNMVGAWSLARIMFKGKTWRNRKFPDDDFFKFLVLILWFNLGGIAFCLQFLCP